MAQKPGDSAKNGTKKAGEECISSPVCVVLAPSGHGFEGLRGNGSEGRI